ncbi:uncharacterized protein PSFLO_06643 [Pseudozyma flocculosa]|uniref:Uncharacterized protein n=1 Tax=Pseudozyma flocculosa TaxID=84751 RepID=A0A5C3FCH9_9BASI|nr:uncharacterized protein PSFLO_06643 [Pseudozyma flocculosa]
MSAESRCPLGFTGTPPVGHPSVPGFSSSKPLTEGSQGAKTGKEWNPYVLLALDAAFLILCVIVAKNWSKITGKPALANHR